MASTRPISIGGIIAASAGFVRRRPAEILILILVLVCLPHWLVAYFIPVPPGMGRQTWIALSILTASDLVFGVLATSAIARLAIDAPAGLRPALIASLRAAFGRFLPVLAATLMADIAILAGLVLLILPGLYLAGRWFALNQVIAAERLGPLTGMWRSAQLTEGHRVLMAALTILSFVVTFALSFVGGLVIDDLNGLGIVASRHGAFGTSLDTIVMLINGLLALPLYTMGYAELRRVREGGSTADLAAVFE